MQPRSLFVSGHTWSCRSLELLAAPIRVSVKTEISTEAASTEHQAPEALEAR